MQATAAAIPFTHHATPAPSTAWAYRRHARRLRDRFRGDPVRLHASLKTLAAEVDAAAPPRPAVRSVVEARQVPARVVPRPADASPAADASVAGASPTIGETVRGVLSAPPAAVDRFAVLVRAMLDEGFIRYSRRQSLLRQAARLGIGRFEATLIIAAVEHRHRARADPAAVLPPVCRRAIGAVVAAVLLLEVAGLLALWATM